jgi:prepilin-type N-terminal cleavage/methylation domain-containing protein
MNSQQQPSKCLSRPAKATRRAFTLVELLVVIAIIGVLAALLVVAANVARRTAMQAAMRAEVNQINDAFTAYGNDISGGSYPPNVIAAQSAGDSVYKDFVNHFKKAFPRSKEPETLLRAIAGLGSGSSPDNLPGGLSPAEAIHFWLGGFSPDPQYPISGPKGPSFNVTQTEDLGARKPTYAFDQARLGPRNADNTFAGRSLRYNVVVNGTQQTRQINFWRYTPNNVEEPYVYFDCSRGMNDREHPNPGTGGQVYAVKTINSTASATAPTLRDLRYCNDGKCQILCCGLDKDWGNFQGLIYVDPATVQNNPGNTIGVLLYPQGPFIDELADTITNFTNNATLADDQQ